MYVSLSSQIALAAILSNAEENLEKLRALHTEAELAVEAATKREMRSAENVLQAQLAVAYFKEVNTTVASNTQDLAGVSIPEDL
jgi:hypothetical protein